ncbi:MAG: hypothetical protein ACRDL8_00440, partial [Solirubrobacteraceae bacterium]
AVICGTVDMIGSRLLFSGYRTGYKGRPLHAGFLGQDALLVHDEAHLEPCFDELLDRIVQEQAARGDRWPLQVMSLTATSRSPEKPGATLELSAADRENKVVAARIGATKRLHLHELQNDRELAERIVAQAVAYKEQRRAVLVFARSVDDVEKIASRITAAGLLVRRL